MHTTQNPIKAFIATHGITMQVSRASSNPNMLGTSCTQHWTCVLRCEDRTMTVAFSQGSAHTQEPTVSDVLECLAMDASSALDKFEDWCDNCGYDTDSRKAYRTWEAVVKQSDDLVALLEQETYDALLGVAF